ncbi:class I SAM-dependent methyltransferase [Psychrobacter arenosus]|uniref:class I SAM-dependent methyltransferase n=1 Tax=Psychrobacter arenosus TaxID=256326 RepID=UPI001917A618|nr:class I SAM-dependent methyltransferase [Psychrobacter arenosus]
MSTSQQQYHSQAFNLTDVPETMLWTLHNRASEALRNDGCLHDPKCVSIYRAIDYDYVRSFGKPDGSHAVRSQLFDKKVRRFIRKRPHAVIINLGDGLETQQFRIYHPETVLWLSIDLPEAIAVRERFISPDAQHRHIAKSVLDTSWFTAVPKDRPVFINAQGLFMYFTPEQLQPLFRAMAERFQGATLMFDYLNTYLSRRTMSPRGWMKTAHYQTPLMPWGIRRNELQPTLSEWIGYPITVHNVTFLFPRGIRRYLIPLLEHIPPVRDRMPGVCWLRFNPPVLINRVIESPSNSVEVSEE